MRKIVLTDLYFRQLVRVGHVTIFHQTLGSMPEGESDAVAPVVLVHSKKKDGSYTYDHCYLASLVYAAKVNPSDTGNYWYKLTLQLRLEIIEL